jgi:hypothetical protein
MRYSTSALITTLLISAAILTPVAHAQTAVPTERAVTQVTPFNLAFLAYQGYLKDQGIPSNGALLNAIDSGAITAQDMIQAAIKANRLPEEASNNGSYRHHLQVQLQGLTAE